MAGNGWNFPGLVLFWPWVINLNGFYDDGEYHVMAFITVLTVLQFKKKMPPRSSALISLQHFHKGDFLNLHSICFNIASALHVHCKHADWQK